VDLLILRDHVYQSVQQENTDNTGLPPLSTTARQSLRAWHRRLRSVGGNASTLAPPSGAFEWLSATRTVDSANHEA
jgi:hypothetical protein